MALSITVLVLEGRALKYFLQLAAQTQEERENRLCQSTHDIGL
jgi:hypothetical protein